MEARLLAVERHAHRLLDRDLRPEELAGASASAGALAAELGRLELHPIARLARLLGAQLEHEGLQPGDAVHIAAITEDIRTLLSSAIAQQESGGQTRGTIVIVGDTTPELDVICWVLASRGHGVTSSRRAPPDSAAPAGVLFSAPDRVDAAAATLLQATAETWAAPIVALYDGDDPESLRTLARRCSTVLPSRTAADIVSAEFARAEAAALVSPSLVAYGRIPRDTLTLLRAHGFRVRRAAQLDAIRGHLLAEPGGVLLGQTVGHTDALDVTRVLRSVPSLRRTPVVWLGATDARDRDHGFRAGMLPVDAVTDAIAGRLGSDLRADLAEQTDPDATNGSIISWSAARVLTDRSLVAAHRSGASVALVLISLDPALETMAVSAVNETLSREFRRGDIVAVRDEHTLVVVLQGVSRRVAANRFTELMDRLHLDEGTSGAAVAMFPSDGRSADELVSAAEEARSTGVAHDGPRVVSTLWRPASQQATDVLVVDSDPVLGRMLASAIAERGHRIELLDNGTAALARLTTEADAGIPRLLLLDLDAAGLDGLSLLRRLRRAGVLVQVNVLLMTARSSESDLRVALGLGVADIIRKPFSSTLLLHRLGRLLEDH